MVDFLGNLKKNLSETAEMVVKKTGEMADVVAKKTEQTVEVTKIKNQIRTMEKNNERDLLDMGKMIYESFKNEEVDERFRELCEAILEREAAIEELNEIAAEIKGMGVCPECKAYVESNATFCSKCGSKLDASEVVAEETVEVEIEDVFEEE